MSPRIQEYAAEGIMVSFDPGFCIHAERCVHGLPEVFDAHARPWIRPGNASPDAVAEVIGRCPTGALSYRRLDGGAAEAPDARATITVSRDGPLFVRGTVKVVDAGGGVFRSASRMALCRCGASRHRPFCDGSHSEAGFRDPAPPPAALEPDGELPPASS